MLSRILAWFHRKLNPPDRSWGICLGCGRRYVYRRRRDEKPGFCSATCVEHDNWGRRG